MTPYIYICNIYIYIYYTYIYTFNTNNRCEKKNMLHLKSQVQGTASHLLFEHFWDFCISFLFLLQYTKTGMAIVPIFHYSLRQNTPSTNGNICKVFFFFCI